MRIPLASWNKHHLWESRPCSGPSKQPCIPLCWEYIQCRQLGGQDAVSAADWTLRGQTSRQKVPSTPGNLAWGSYWWRKILIHPSLPTLSFCGRMGTKVGHWERKPEPLPLDSSWVEDEERTGCILFSLLLFSRHAGCSGVKIIPYGLSVTLGALIQHLDGGLPWSPGYKEG